MSSKKFPALRRLGVKLLEEYRVFHGSLEELRDLCEKSAPIPKDYTFNTRTGFPDRNLAKALETKEDNPLNYEGIFLQELERQRANQAPPPCITHPVPEEMLDVRPDVMEESVFGLTEPGTSRETIYQKARTRRERHDKATFQPPRAPCEKPNPDPVFLVLDPEDHHHRWHTPSPQLLYPEFNQVHLSRFRGIDVRNEKGEVIGRVTDVAPAVNNFVEWCIWVDKPINLKRGVVSESTDRFPVCAPVLGRSRAFGCRLLYVLVRENV